MRAYESKALETKLYVVLRKFNIINIILLLRAMLATWRYSQYWLTILTDQYWYIQPECICAIFYICNFAYKLHLHYLECFHASITKAFEQVYKLSLDM